MSTPISTIMNNVNVVLVDSSIITSAQPYIVYISSVSIPGRVATVRDATGYLSSPNKIIVSTLKNVLISPNISTFTITQPYGYITVTPRNSTIWAVLNTFAFNDHNASANTSNLYVNYQIVSTIDARNINVSTISTLASGWSQVNIGSTLQTGLFSTMGNINMGGRFSTPNVIVSGSTIYTVHLVSSNLSTGTGYISSLRGDTATITNLSTTTGFISSLRGDTATITNLSTTTGFISSLSVMTGFISSTTGYNAVFSNISATTGYISSLQFGSLVNINATFTPNFLTMDIGSNAVPTSLTTISTLRVFGTTYMVGSNGGLSSILNVIQLKANQDIVHVRDATTNNYIYMGMNATTTTMNIGAYNYVGAGRSLSLQANGGSVGIGNINPTYTLDVVGTIRASSDVIASSDERVKTNIVSVTSALSTIHEMRGVFYSLLNDPTTRKLGCIAQEVERVLPEVVQTDDSKEAMKSIAYGNITALLIEGIKELSSTVQGMRSSKSFA